MKDKEYCYNLNFLKLLSINRKFTFICREMRKIEKEKYSLHTISTYTQHTLC